MKNKYLIAPLMTLGLGLMPASAMAARAGHDAQQEVRIPFVNHGGIRDWRVENQDTLYVQDRARHWYRVTLMRPVIGLESAWGIGFRSSGADTFDRFSDVVVRGERIAVQSIVPVPAPPVHQSRAHHRA